MAGGNLSPRMKMVSLMYLVFISMMAMNMSKEVLASFGSVNEKLEDSNARLKSKNNAALAFLEIKAREAPDQFAEVKKKADIVYSYSKEILGYIEGLKNELLSNFEKPYDYMVMDNSTAFDERFFIGSPDRKKFLDEFETYRSAVEPIIKDNDPEMLDSFVDDFDIRKKITDREGVSMSYLDYHFMGYPIASTISKLSFLQNNIHVYQSELLSKFLSGQLSKIASMDNYTTLLELPKTAFYSGDIFEGAVVLGRKDSSTKPNKISLKFGNRELSKNEYSIRDGKVTLKFRAPSPGDYDLSGELTYLQEGKEVVVPVRSTVSIIGRPSEAVISAEKMNVVYRGVENPINISVAGVPSNKIKVTAPGIKKENTGYVLSPGKGREVTISVSANIDGKTVTSNKVFRIKDIPRPSGTVSKQVGNVKLPAGNLEMATIGAILEDFDFDISLKVSSFKVSVPGQPSVLVNGNKMNSAAKRVLKRVRKGDLVQIFDIKASIEGNSSYKLKKVSPVMVQIQ